ncbi:MAG: ATP-dependent RecD-like DNA helicase [Proteobacteria bacterium]|nr:ATP-dependent RecD-like DNA helicase [Pseudomonadota bacterium]
MRQSEMSAQPRAEQTVLRGVIERVTYRNPQNGYSVIKVLPSDSPETVTVVGACGDAAVGTHVVIRGNFIDHPKFGRQFAVASFTETSPSTPEGLKKYLSSGLVKGIGEKTAARIVAAFGEATVEVILQQPEKVAKIAGVGKSKAATLHETLKAAEATRETKRFLLEHNIPRGLADKLIREFKQSTVEVISKDPYMLARSMKGVGFATADAIAMNVGLKPDSPQRLKAGLFHALERAAEDGHCYLSVKQLFEQSQVLLGVEAALDLTEPFHALVREGFIVHQEDTAALRHLHKAEEFVADFVARRVAPWEHPPLRSEDVTRALSAAAQDLGVTFSPEQEASVEAAAKYPLLIVTGGPGCGKTTIIRALSTLYRLTGKRLVLAAPTGRAAQRMSQVCGMPASTIHRLLRFDPMKRSFLFGPNQPLEIDALIVDEASMIDILLAKDLFSAVPREATIILVGDRDQLPSVGPGRVFGDLVSLHEVKTIALSRLFRRSEESQITSIAHMINSGLVPTIPEPDGNTKSDAYFLNRTDPEEAAQLIERLVADQIPRKFGFARGEVCVLTPTNRGPLGAIALNQRLQGRVNPSGSVDAEQELTVGDTTVRIRDRVCQRVNNYNLDQLGVYNGDLGTVYSVDRSARSLVVELWDGRLVKYDEGDIPQLSLAYAITVHRSQGSEIPCVVLALHDSQYTLLERQLIYTAVTRAKKLLIIVGSRRALQIASKRATTAKRLSRLAPRIRGLVQQGTA